MPGSEGGGGIGGRDCKGLEVGEGMESPLDVLSRAATMVEAVNTSGSSTPGSRPADTEDKHSPPSLVNK